MKQYRWAAVLVAAMLLAAVAGCGSTAAPAAPAKFPTKAINLYPHTTAGSPGDLFARNVAKALEKSEKWTFQIENKSGAQGVEAMNWVVSQPADGYTVVSFTKSQLISIAQGIGGGVTSPTQMFVLALLQGDPLALGVKKDAPWKTLQELLAYVKANPGKVSYSVAGAAGIQAISSIIFSKKAGIGTNWKLVGYEGQAESMKALLSGEVQAQFGTSGGISQYVRSGDFRLLAIATDKRVPSLPDVPTFKEAGVDHTDMQWRGYLARPGIPQNVLDVWYAALKKVPSDADFKAATEKEGMTVLEGMAGGDTQKTVEEQYKLIKDAVDSAGLGKK